MSKPQVEYAVEATWVDPVEAGAGAELTIFGPFDTDRIEGLLKDQRSGPSVAAERVLTRLASYSEWEPVGDQKPASDEERNALLDDLAQSLEAETASHAEE